MSKEKIYLWKDHSGRGEKPVTLKESNIRKTWDLKELDDENQMLLSYFLDNSDEGDIWTSGTETLEHIETKEIEMKKRKKPIIKDTVDESLKSKLIGRTVGLDGEDPDSFHKIVNVDREIIEFDGEKSNNYKIVLDGEESYFIHPDAIQDFFNGDDIGAFLKSNYKGGTIMLIDKDIDMNKSLDSIEKEAKSFLIKAKEIEKEELETGKLSQQDMGLGDENELFNRLRKEVGYSVDEVEEDRDYLLKATSSEAINYVLSTIIPKLRKMNSNILSTEEQIKWLEKFIEDWDKVGDDFLKEAALQSKYDQFLIDNNLPSESADDLLISLNDVNSSHEFISKNEANLVNNEIVYDGVSFHIKELLVNTDGDIILESTQKGSEEVKEIILKLKDLELLVNKKEVTVDGKTITLYGKEKTPFNDSYEFVEEFSGYLIGKYITFGKGEKYKITEVVNDGHVSLVYDKHGERSFEHLFPSINLQAFIDGEEVDSAFEDGKFSLIIQEDISPFEEKINQSDYKYYIFNTKNKEILEGFEFKEDASDRLDELKFYGNTDYVLENKRSLLANGLDPNNNKSWGNETCDYAIIEEAVKFGVTEGDYDEEWVGKYIDGYKNGKYNSVIKARLVYYLDHANKHFKGAITSSRVEKALKFKEIISRISDELLRIIKKDL